MMESMHYVNIFETKGLEYLLVISFLIGFVFLVRRLSYSHTNTVPAAASKSAVMAPHQGLAYRDGADCPHEQGRVVAREEEKDEGDEAVIA